MQLTTQAETALQTVIAKFKTGAIAPIIEVVRLRPLQTIPSDNWSLSNRILVYLQTGTLDCRGYRQWQVVGRHVRSGARAAYILAPCTRIVNVSGTTSQSSPDSTPFASYQEEDETGEERLIITGFRPIPVFPAHHTEGKPLPVNEYLPTQLPPLSDVAAQLGVKVSYLPLPPSRYGDCTTSGDSIRLGTHDEAVFFHELAHAAHAHLAGTLRGGQHADQETVAEFTAAVLSELYGVRDHSGNAWHYISLYNPDPLTAIVKAVSTVEKVLALLTAAPALNVLPHHTPAA